MIGPHQGKELELMLEGKKHLAVFHDALIENEDIPEEIIPERLFLPYLENGTFFRLSQDFIYANTPHPARFVCFTAAGEEWRARAFLWMQQECIAGRRPFDEAYEFFVGRLLGYEEADIKDFISHRKSFKCAPLT